MSIHALFYKNIYLKLICLTTTFVAVCFLLDTIVVRGATPIYTRATPTMDSTKVYTFTFKRWNKEIVVAKSDMVYTAVYDSTPVLYTSVFKDYDGTTIETVEKCAYDSVIDVKNLVRVSSGEYNYVFGGWSKDESQIKEKILVYTAVYDSFLTKKNGAIRAAVYKISSTDSVYFSQGNLQFTTQGTHKTSDSTAKGTWRFAENQYDYIGSTNEKISAYRSICRMI